MPIEIVDFKPMTKGALRGFADVRHQTGITLRACPVFARDGRAWADVPGRLIGRTERGRALIEAAVTFPDPAMKIAWSGRVIRAMRLAHPDVLA